MLRAVLMITSCCFQMGQFYYAAKAFDTLEKLDPGSNYWEGKRGACVGIFQLILANKESKYVFLFFSCALMLILDFIVAKHYNCQRNSISIKHTSNSRWDV